DDYTILRTSFLNNCFPKTDVDAQFALAYLRLILRRLLHWRTPYERSFYTTAGAVVRDLGRLTQPLGDAQLVPELEVVPQHVMRLPVWGNLPFTPRFDALF